MSEWNCLREEQLRTFSSAELKECLHQDLLSDVALLSPETIGRIVGVLRERGEVLGADAALDVSAAWTDFETHFMEGETDEGETAVPSQGTQSGKRVFSWKRIIGIAAVVCVMLSLLLSARGFGRAALQTIARWTDELFRLELSDAGTESGTEAVRAALAEKRLPEEFTPARYPEGYSLEDVSLDKTADFDALRLLYTDGAGGFFRIKLTVYNSAVAMRQYTMEKTPEAVVFHTQGDRLFYVLENTVSVSAVCAEGLTVMTISGNLTKAQLEDIVSSIGGPL